eukprot:9380831-Alexandrium_andersonii.AAC.1
MGIPCTYEAAEENHSRTGSPFRTGAATSTTCIWTFRVQSTRAAIAPSTRPSVARGASGQTCWCSDRPVSPSPRSV